MKHFSSCLIISSLSLAMLTGCVAPVQYARPRPMPNYINPYTAPGYGSYNYNYNPYPVVTQPYYGGGREYRNYGGFREHEEHEREEHERGFGGERR